MNEIDIKFLQDSFKKYYFNHFDLITSPERTSEREFGYQKFNSGMFRHISLKDNKELHLLFMQNIPSDVYCSNAYYAFPNSPMSEKDWKEADLIFDIDAKDLNLSCRKNHTISICNECNEISKDTSQCVKCNSTKLEKKSLPCKNCIDASKIEVNKLSNVLINDLGIDKENIHVYFSGNEGFHVYVYHSQFQQMGSKERSELVEKGWNGRFSKYVFGSKSKRSKIISELLDSGYPSFQKTLDDVSENIGVKIDPNVTMDIHRIFRLPGSINSKSGLTKILCTDLTKFNPYTDACFLNDDSVEVLANCPIEFKLKNKKFGPYTNEKISLPTYAAVYMICKKLATIA